MKRRFYIAAIAVVLAAGLAGGVLQGAGPGGADDPLVSRSYLDLRLIELRQSIGTGQPAQNATYIPVFVPAGQILLAGEGAEIILRSGIATAHVPGPDGIVNVTSGVDMPAGAVVSANNLLIVPRADGRGILAVTDTWFIVKGQHSIVN